MDDAYISSNSSFNGTTISVYEKVDKNPPYNIFYLEVQPWHSPGQASTIEIYKYITLIALCFCLYVVIGTEIFQIIQSLFCTSLNTTGDVVGIPFFSVPKIGCYCPIIQKDGDTFVCADTSQAMEEFQPSVAAAINLSFLVPEEHRRRVLSIVKWYGLGKTTKAANLLPPQKVDSQIPDTTSARKIVAPEQRYLVNTKKIQPTLEGAVSTRNELDMPLSSGNLLLLQLPSQQSHDLHKFDSNIDITKTFLDAQSPDKKGRKRLKHKDDQGELPPVLLKRQLSSNIELKTVADVEAKSFMS
jgi:hypothetical protein